jgi:serine protease Do
VNGAEKIEVFVSPRPDAGARSDSDQDTLGKSYQARIVGTTREIDLAVIKIEAHALSALSINNGERYVKRILQWGSASVINGSMQPTRQGNLVFAFGSPEGLRNTVTMGVVSSVARQHDPDSALVYLQTDTPINPGNSGGPLVDADGELVGINTFILSTSAGNQGLGFAIPAGVVAYAYPATRFWGGKRR